MADYGKRKNDELAALCKERGLPHTGKKADLVKRLEDHDASSDPAAAPLAAGKATSEDDEIDWDDEPATEQAKAATSEPAAAAIAAGGVGEVANPQAVPNQIPVIDPSQTDDLSIAQSAPPADAAAANGEAAPAEVPKEEEKDYSTGLADRTLEEEIEKRKARARKFGMAEDSDEIKALERARRFGTTDLPGLLNKALPSGLDRKRGREVAGAEHDGGIRKRSRGRPNQGGGRGSGRRDRERGGTPGSGGHPGWMTDKDREAAERRKAKFATVGS